MQTFSYVGRDLVSDKQVKSTVQAESERAAAKLLISQGISPLNIRIETGSNKVLGVLRDRITTKDRVIFTRQLATLLNASVPLAQALRTAVDQTANKKLAAVISEVVVGIEAGSSLSDSLAKHPHVFNTVYVSLVASGEASGTLDKALERIASQQEKDAELLAKVRGALVYPMIVLFVIGGVVLFMLLSVVPQIEKLYEDLNQELPFITAAMVGMSKFIINFWYILAAAVAGAIYFSRIYFKSNSGMRAVDTLKINLPIFGPMFKKLYMARFARTGETLLASGVPMLQMLTIAAQAINNIPVSDAIKRAADKVKGGKTLSTSLKNEDVIAPLVPQMISIGEQSGGIDKMMGKAASYYENELDNTVRSISTAIEPVLMVILAVVAGLLVGAILLPIYGLIGSGGIR